MSNRVILITGASAGIGRSCAIGLSKAFPSVDHPEKLVLVLVGRRQEELEKTGQMCREGTIIEIGTGDIGKEEEVERIFSVVKEKYGRLDLLFNVSDLSSWGTELTGNGLCERPYGSLRSISVILVTFSLPEDVLTALERRCKPTRGLPDRRERHDQIQIRSRDKHHGRCPCAFLGHNIASERWARRLTPDSAPSRHSSS